MASGQQHVLFGRCNLGVAVTPPAASLIRRDPSLRRSKIAFLRRQPDGRQLFCCTAIASASPQPQTEETKSPTEKNSLNQVPQSNHGDEKSPAAEDRVDALAWLVSDGTFVAEVSRSQDASEALEIICAALEKQGALQETEMTAAHVNRLFVGCLERSCVDLCLSIYRQMIALPRLGDSEEGCLMWPAVNFEVTCSLVLALARRMRVSDALSVMQSMAVTAASENAQEIIFGKVISSPIPPYTPLAVVQPQEGIKQVACASSRYMFELFSGEVTSVRSDSLEPSNDALIAVARFLKLWKRPQLRAVHELIVTTPTGTQRSFRFGTEFADVPAKKGDRVTVVCTPATNKQRILGVFAPIPQNTRPGEALTITNHATSVSTPAIRAPAKNTVESFPSWILPAAIVLAGSDVASSMVDPNLPLIGAASVAAIGAATVLSDNVLLPRLKQLPEKMLGAEPLRQELLREHQILITKIQDLVRDASNDVRSLAKLWQLESKMTSVDSSGKYEARIQRIDRARQSLETRLAGRLELIYGYRRVANMIEIEVEMDVDVPAAEIEGIEEQLTKLEEVENLQKEMEYQVEAQDEVERLLQSTDRTEL